MPLSKIEQSSVNSGVAGTGPAFSAYLSTQQNVSNSTWTKVALQTEEFDTANCFDSTTNYRFTPNVAGYYQINGAIAMNAITTNPTWSATSIWKNGSSYKQVRAGTGPSSIMPIVSTIVYLNGTTDYVELYGYMVGATNGDFDAGINYTWFNGTLVRAA